ncbi:MAG: lipocalin family protein [Planctomycetia bacterium]|nr:lipocalin family protein [Planctomycetia bacterium]
MRSSASALLFRAAASVLAAASSLLPAGCASAPRFPGVGDFDAPRYQGRWYEIARLPNSFEEGLTDISAEYELREDGTLSVVNRGWDPEDREWDEAHGSARFRGDARTAELRVTFFWPFYGGYNVIELDREGYRWSLVAGDDTDYLWLLAREPKLDPAVEESLLAKARELGFDLSRLVRVPHGVAPGR